MSPKRPTPGRLAGGNCDSSPAFQQITLREFGAMERPAWVRLYRPRYVRRPSFWPAIVIQTWGFPVEPGRPATLGTPGLWTYIIVDRLLGRGARVSNQFAAARS